MALSAGVGFVDLLPRINAAAFTAAANAQMKAVGTKTATSFSSAFGAALKPVGIAAIGLAAIQIGKLTLEFENAFTRIAAISNASAAQIEQWRGAVMTLGRETAVAPQKLADGLFFLASAGLEANQIFPALEASAKGAAIGLGEMEDITRTVAQVLNAFPEAGLQAVDVVDALTAAVRESTAEPEEFAQALGRLLPIASKAQVGVEELVGSLATLSNIGLDVDEGVTGVRQVLNLIVSPGKQATETMQELGIATEDLRDRLAGKGLLNTLRFLEKRVGGNEDQFRKLLPNIRAMTAAFGLTVQEAEKVDGIFRRVANSSGDLNKALEETQKGPGFRFRKFMVTLQEAAISLGQVFLPTLQAIALSLGAIVVPLSELLGLMAAFPGTAFAVTAALVGFAAASFVPVLLEAIAVKLVALNAAALGSTAINLIRIVDVLKALTPALIGQAALGIGLIAGSTILLAKATAARNVRNLRAARQEVLNLGTTSRTAKKSVRDLGLEMARQGGASFRLPITAEDSAELGKNFDRALTHLERVTKAENFAKLELGEIQTEVKNIGPGFQGATQAFAEFTDQSMPEFTRGLRKGLHDGSIDIGKWNDYVAGQVGEAAEAFEDFSDRAFEALDFTGSALGDLASESASAMDQLAGDLSGTSAEDIARLRDAADITAGELLQATRDARRETRAFFDDLAAISATGGPGKAVADLFIGIGQDAAGLADTIASAPKKVQQELITNIAENQKLTETLSERLTRKILGTLNDIKQLFEDIAIGMGLIPDPDVNVQGDAETKLDTILDRMREIDAFEATADVTAIYHRAGPPVIGPELGGFDPRQTAAGGVVGAQHGGIVRRPTLLTGEGRGHTPYGRGAEGILPLDDHTMGRLGASVARQIELPTIIVKVGEEELARTVTRGQRRRRALVGA